MKCEKIQGLLKTDFLDGELDKKLKSYIQNHIDSCDSCKTLWANLYQKTVAPFKNLKEIKPPESVWSRIEKETLAGAKEPFSLLDWLKDKLPPLFYFPKPAYAFAAMVLICFMTYFLYFKPSANKRQEANEYLLDQASFIQELETENYSFGVDSSSDNYL